MGFPGVLHVNVTHTITENSVWAITYSAVTGSATVVAMTNHAHFNLNANLQNTATILGHVMRRIISFGETGHSISTRAFQYGPSGGLRSVGPFTAACSYL
jgi:galactose mutarotase-like enzyme